MSCRKLNWTSKRIISAFSNLTVVSCDFYIFIHNRRSVLFELVMMELNRTREDNYTTKKQTAEITH